MKVLWLLGAALGAVILATLGVALPHWLDVARIELLLALAFGSVVTALGRETRYLPAARLSLMAGWLAQFGFVFVSVQLAHSQCGADGLDSLLLTAIFLPAALTQFPIIAAPSIALAYLFCRAVVISRVGLRFAPLVISFIAIVGLAIVLGDAVSWKCPDF